MGMHRNLGLDFTVGIFVSIGFGLIMLAVLLLGGANTLFTQSHDYFARFKTASGLIPGAKVVLNGLQVGTVDTVTFDDEVRAIRATFSINSKYENWLNQNARAEIITQGVMGDKYLSITSEETDHPPLAPGAEIHAIDPRDLGKFLNNGEQLVTTFNSIGTSLDRLLQAFESANRSELFFDGMAKTAKNLEITTQRLNEQLDRMKLADAVNHLSGILQKIDGGQGTLGALVNDPALYDDALALMGGANRNRMMRNIVRKAIRDSEEAAPAP